MNLRKYFALFLTLAGLVVVAFIFLRDVEPSYEGKPLSQWISGLEYENVNPSDQQRAALSKMGAPAVKKLIALLEKKDSAWKQKFIKYARKNPAIYNRFIAPRHVVPESVYHAQAVTALGEIGPSAAQAIPALTAATTDERVSLRASAALIKIRQESVASLLVILADSTSPNWEKAAQTAKYLGTNAAAAVPLLVPHLQSTNVYVRECAAAALGGIASDPDLAVPALLSCLEDKSPDVRGEAVDSLRKFKMAKEQIVPKLLPILLDTDLNVWLGAAFGLEEVLSHEEKKTLFVPLLIQSLHSSDPTIRANAKLFLDRVDPSAATKAGVR